MSIYISPDLIYAGIVLFGIYLIALFSIFENEKILAQRSITETSISLSTVTTNLGVFFKSKKEQLSIDTFVIK